MLRSSPLRSGLGLLLSLAGLSVGGLFAAPNPSFTVNAGVHDPAVIKEGNTWWVFGSHMASAYSTDLMNWTQYSTSVAVGNPLTPNPFVDYSEVLTWAQTTTFWAPDVFKMPDGKFYFYYCACQGSMPLSGLGLAKGTTIGGPYINQQLLLKSGGTKAPNGTTTYNAYIHPNVVDPSMFYDKDGKFWMVYGSYSGGIFILEMDKTTGLIKPGQGTAGFGTHLVGGDHSTIEGATIFYSPETDYYYLFCTYGGLGANDGYNIRQMRSRNPDGPYYDASGKDMSTVRGSNANIAPWGVKVMGNWQFARISSEPGTLNRGYKSPGGVSFYRDIATGSYIGVMHLRFVGRGEQHEVRTFQFFLNEDGWFVASPHRYAKEAIATSTSDKVTGFYKIINHGKDITGTVKTSTSAWLVSGGTISGGYTGTWSISGDHYATIVIGGVTYKGVFAQHWDDDCGVWVSTFSAVSSDGVSLWGSRMGATYTDTTPTFTQQPVAKTVKAGTSVSFSVAANASPAPSYQWRLNGQNIAGATSSTLTLENPQEADAGYYVCVVGNKIAAFNSDPALLTVIAPLGVSTQPASSSVTAGQAASFSVVANITEGTTYQWRKYGTDGVARAVSGATSATLSISEASSEEAGTYDCVITNGEESVTTQTATLTVAILTTPNPDCRLVNISARAQVSNGAETTNIGFVLKGTGSESLLVRASGASLLPYGVTNYVADPQMSVYNQLDIYTSIGANDDWGSTTALKQAFARVEAFDWQEGTTESALVQSFTAGEYTAVVNGKTSAGIGLVELYEDATSGPRLVNISARALMSSGQQVLTAGFVIKGTGLKTVLVRLSGPALSQWLGGYAADPYLKVFNQNDTNNPIAVNDDWDSNTAKGDELVTVGGSLGAFAWTRGSKDAAILLTLRPGRYTAEGLANGVPGVALVEVYEVNF